MRDSIHTMRRAAMVAAATALTTALFWQVAGPATRVDPGGDYAANYEPVARAIRHEGRPVLPDGSIATRYPPGYPGMLAAVFWLSATTGASEARLLQGFALVTTALAGVWLFLLAQAVWPRPFAYLTPALWATCPFVLWVSAIEGSEPAFFAVFFAGCVVAWRAIAGGRLGPSLAGAGALMGLAMLVRPIAIGAGVLVAVAVWTAWRSTHRPSRRLAGAALVLAGNLVVVGPWLAWVAVETGRVIVLADGGAPSMRDGLTYATNLKGYRAGVSVPPDVQIVMRAVQDRYQSLHTIGDITRVLGEQAQERPVAVGKLLLLKAARSWYGTDSHRRERAILALQIAYLIPVIVGGVVAWRRGTDGRLLTVAIAVSVVYFWAMTILVLSIARYMLPALGLLFVLAPGSALLVLRRYAGVGDLRQTEVGGDVRRDVFREVAG